MLPAAVAVVLGVLAARAYRRGERDADAWAQRRQLDLTDDNRGIVAWYLRSSRALRLLGVLAGVVLVPLAALAAGDQSFGSRYFWFAVVGGYLVGIVYAEVSLRRPPGRGASLRTRHLDDYLSPWARRAQRRTAAFSALVAGGALAVPAREPGGVGVPSPGVLLAAALVVLVGVEMLQRWLIRRPQPVVSDALLAADDAIRIQSVHSIAGAGMALQLLLAGAAMWVLAGSDVQVLRWTMWVPALVSWGAALAACTRFDDGLWQVRRT